MKQGIVYDSGIVGALATVGVEVRTFAPINEYGGPRYWREMYDISGKRPHVARQLGNTEIGDGELFHGRGFIQLTGRANYRAMSTIVGIDLEKHPEAALRQPAASLIFAHYFRSHGCDVWAQNAWTTALPKCTLCVTNGLVLKNGKLIKPTSGVGVCVDCSWKMVRRKVNGGLSHFSEFMINVNNLKAVLDAKTTERRPKR